MLFEIGVPVMNIVPRPGVRAVDVARLRVEIESALAGSRLHAADFGRELQVLEKVRLVDKQRVRAGFLERQALVLGLRLDQRF